MQDVILWAAGVIFSAGFAVTGWVINMILGKIDKNAEGLENLNRGLNAHKLHAANTYANKVDVKDMTDRIMNKLEKIDDKLDSKMDKH